MQLSQFVIQTKVCVDMIDARIEKLTKEIDEIKTITAELNKNLNTALSYIEEEQNEHTGTY